MIDAEPAHQAWRTKMVGDLASGDITLSTQALLALTYDDPDREWLENLLLREVDEATDPQLRALAVTCMGHLGRLRGEVDRKIVSRLEALRADNVLGGIAEDALGDIRHFATVV